MMEKPVRPVFSFELNCELIPGLVTVGKYDGTHPCVTLATKEDKVLIHSPHKKVTSTPYGKIEWSESNKEIATLNIFQQITAIAAERIVPDETKDILLIGTHSNLLAYNVHDNTDIFYRDCPDGVKTIRFGPMSDSKKSVIIVGGNSTIHGFDHKGTEVYWLAIGDTVTSVLLIDFNKDGYNEIMVCTEDCSIKVFKECKMIAENLETNEVTILTALPENRFSYALKNGTIGVYELDVRLWRVKSKHQVVASFGYDLLAQGTLQLITGWSNGKIDCRSIKTGEILFKDILECGIAGIVEADYRSNGKCDLVIVTINGTVKGFSTTKPSTITFTLEQQEETIKELLAEKQKILEELKSDEVLKIKDGEREYLEDDLISSGIIPANTKVTATISNDDASKSHLELALMTNNSTIIKAALIFAEGIFEDDSLIVNPPLSKLSSLLLVPLKLLKDVSTTLLIKTLVGYPASEKFHVFEFQRPIPQFSMYCLTEINENLLPSGFVEFEIRERLQRICMWINQSFMLPADVDSTGKSKIILNFKCLRSGNYFQFVFENNGKHKIVIENMSLAACFIQALAKFLKLDNLKSTCNFPKEENQILQLINDLDEIQIARERINAVVAQKIEESRILLAKAEDCRIHSISEMGRYYHELTMLNKELINEQNIKLKNYQEGVTAIKTINSIIKNASRLRVGQSAANVLSECKKSIENNNVEALIRIIRNG